MKFGKRIVILLSQRGRYYRAGHKMGCWLVSIPLTLLTEDRQRYENAGDGDFMALHVLLVRINLITTIFSAISLAINW